MIGEWLKGKAIQSLEVDPPTIRDRVAQWEAAGATSDDALRQRAESHHARRAAMHGFATGIIPGVVGSLVVSLFDARGIARERAAFAATCAYIMDRRFFDDPSYALAIARSLDSGDLVLSTPSGEDGWGNTALAFHAKQYARRALRRGALRWIGKKVVGGPSSFVLPVVGGAVGAAWNYGELKWVGLRFRDDFRATA